MHNYKYGTKSKKRLSELHPTLEFVAYRAMEIANTVEACPDFSIIDGLRTMDQQFELYKRGRQLLGDESGARWTITEQDDVVTWLDGINTISQHQKGLALDFCAWVDGTSFDPKLLKIIASCFIQACEENNIEYVWGGDWDTPDMPHFQIKP